MDAASQLLETAKRVVEEWDWPSPVGCETEFHDRVMALAEAIKEVEIPQRRKKPGLPLFTSGRPTPTIEKEGLMPTDRHDPVDLATQEWDLRFRFHLLKEAIKQVQERGMAFQDEPWWPEFDALTKALERKESDAVQGS